MSQPKPFFSVIIPTYNRANLIKVTLESVLNQTFDNFEIVVINDGGTDNTEEVVRSFSSDKIRYFNKKNGERGAARNFGISQSNGIYITFLDSDDIVYPIHFEEAYRFIQAHSDALCFAQAYETKDAITGKLLLPARLQEAATVNDQIVKGNFLSCFGVFVRRDVLDEVNFEEDRNFSGTEDWLLWIKLAARYPFYFNNKVTGAMLEHENRSVLSFQEKDLAYRTDFIIDHLRKDEVFMRTFGPGTLNRIYAHMLTYASLHLAMSRRKKVAWQYLMKGIRANRRELFTRRSMAILKLLAF